MNAYEALDDLIDQFVAAQTRTDILTATALVAREILPAVACHIVAAEGDELAVLAGASAEGVDEQQPLPIHTDLVGRMSLIGRSYVLDDYAAVRGTAAQRADPPEQAWPRSLLLVPMEDIGVFVASAREPDAFDATDREWAEQLVSCAILALSALTELRADGDRTDRLDRIANIISHEFTGPISVVRGSLELAEETDEDEHFERARRALDRLEHLVDGLETLLRSGDHLGQPDLVELRTAAREAWTAVETEDASLTVVDSRAIVADRNALNLLLANLFNNAIAHGGATTTVSVGGLQAGFYVADDGPGIPSDERSRIFEWGFSSTEGHKGIGLSIVEQICESHGWSVTVTESDAGGARFEFTGVAEEL